MQPQPAKSSNIRGIKTGREGQRHQRVKSDGVHLLNNSAFQNYSGRMQSLAGINHKRGKSGQNEGLLPYTLEEIEDGVGVNSQYNDNELGMMAEEESKHPEADQTAFID